MMVNSNGNSNNDNNHNSNTPNIAMSLMKIIKTASILSFCVFSLCDTDKIQIKKT